MRGSPAEEPRVSFSVLTRASSSLFSSGTNGRRFVAISAPSRVDARHRAKYRLDPADLADESVADEVIGSLQAAFVRPAPRPPQLLESNGAGKTVKVLRPAQRPGYLPPDDVVHHVRAAAQALDGPQR